jgi:hypothetical protein
MIFSVIFIEKSQFGWLHARVFEVNGHKIPIDRQLTLPVDQV